jgi:hypothetical protein
MNFNSTIRQIRRSIGLQPAGLADFVLPAMGILAVGIVAGAGIALLFAPMTGRKLREEMEQKLSDYRSRLMVQEGDQTANHQAPRNNVKATEPFPRI